MTDRQSGDVEELLLGSETTIISRLYLLKTPLMNMTFDLVYFLVFKVARFHMFLSNYRPELYSL